MLPLAARYNCGSFGACWTQTPIGPILELRLISLSLKDHA
jgi:hypothetical protein